MDVTQKYRQTDVGVIPSDWSVAPLGRLISSVEYGSSAKSSANGRIPVLRMGNLQRGQIDWSDLVFTDNDSEIAKYALRPGDVLFNRTNTIDLVGKTALYEGERPAIFAGYLIRVSVDQALLSSVFLNYVLNAEFSRKYSAKVLSVAVGQANINSQKLKTYPIPLPPDRAEQEAIAAALSDVDALIASLDRLIAKKRDLKQAAMQQLLTGKTRLPGFSGNGGWVSTTVRDIASSARNAIVGGPFGSDLVSSDYVDDGVPVIRGQNMNGGWVSGTFAFVTHAKARTLEANLARPGDLVFTQRGTLGQVALVPNEPFESYLVSQSQMKVTVDRATADPTFLFHVFASRKYQALIIGSAIQTGVPHINLGILRSYPIQLPTLAEQLAIARVLSDLDAELVALEQRRDKTRLLKQGMMQELLTGRTRLV